MEKSQRKSGIVLSYLLILINNIVLLIYTPFLLRKLGQSEFGIYSLVASVISYLTILDFGFGNAVIRYTAKYRGNNDKVGQYSLHGMFLVLYLGVGIIALVIGLILYSKVDVLFGSKLTSEEVVKARIMMLLLSFNLAITFPLSIFNAIIQAYEKFVFQKIVIILRII